jgi:flagellar biosynthesis protein FlhF
MRDALEFNEVASNHIAQLLDSSYEGRLQTAIEAILPNLGSSIWNKKSRMTFVGATGVGKTTSIAKLAAQAKSRGLRVGLVTIDTYRVAAVEQLSKYAELLGLPFLTAGSASELRDALERFQNADLVFVDTAGAGTWDRARLEELNAILDCGLAIEKTLLLPASGNKRDYESILSAFGPFGIDSISVSKLDETCCFGPCFSSLVNAQLPVSFFGIGPNVPSDMEQASISRIQRLITRKTH